MRYSSAPWHHFLLLALLASLLASCLPAPTGEPDATSGFLPLVTRTLPPPSQTRTVLAQPTQTGAALPSVTPTLASSKLGVDPTGLKGENVLFWYAASGEVEQVLQLLVGEFNQTNDWGVRVRAVAYPGPGVLDEAVLQGAAEKRLPDLLGGYIDQAQRWETSGVPLVELTNYVDDAAWGLTEAEQKDFFPAFWQQGVLARRQGSGSTLIDYRLGVPWYRSGLLVFYNRTWANELGFRSPPDTPNEFRQQACAAAQANRRDRERTNDGTGGWLYVDDPLVLLGWIHAFDGSIVDESGRAYRFDSPEAEGALSFMRDLAADGCAWDAGEQNPVQAFAERRTLLWIGSLFALTEQQIALQQFPNDDEWDVLPFPSTTAEPVIVAYGPELVVVKSTPERQLAAWLFARWLVSPLNQAHWAEVGELFPVRRSALEQQLPASSGLAQWRQALKYLPYARSEPSSASWGALRWALADVQAQLLAPGFSAEHVSDLLEVLDQLAAEVNALPR